MYACWHTLTLAQVTLTLTPRPLAAQGRAAEGARGAAATPSLLWCPSRASAGKGAKTVWVLPRRYFEGPNPHTLPGSLHASSRQVVVLGPSALAAGLCSVPSWGRSWRPALRTQGLGGAGVRGKVEGHEGGMGGFQTRPHQTCGLWP